MAAGVTVPFQYPRTYGDRNGTGLIWTDIWHHYQHDPTSNLGSFRRGNVRLPYPLRVVRSRAWFVVGRRQRLVLQSTDLRIMLTASTVTGRLASSDAGEGVGVFDELVGRNSD